ncbi:MAG: SprT family zinc-dependent metalloprotease [Desulfobacterales bacterium]|nr:SprT family zinc-dependent metalloprotease [Desulfobacterales bacterium]
MKAESQGHLIQFGRRRIPYLLHRSQRKSLRIVVRPDMTVNVYAPMGATDDEVHSALSKKGHLIARAIDKFEAYQPLPSPRRFVSGETLAYLGRQYRLKIEKGPKQPAKLLGRFLWVWTEDRTDVQGIKGNVESWYRKRAHETLGRLVEKCCSVASRHGVPRPQVVIRSMRTRWGSCSSTGRITLNVNLVQAPVHCIEYVIMHEVCHLKHHNHSKIFYSLLTRCQPDWRKRKEMLDRFRVS